MKLLIKLTKILNYFIFFFNINKKNKIIISTELLIFILFFINFIFSFTLIYISLKKNLSFFNFSSGKKKKKISLLN
jgi:hypothetical protein